MEQAWEMSGYGPKDMMWSRPMTHARVNSGLEKMGFCGKGEAPGCCGRDTSTSVEAAGQYGRGLMSRGILWATPWPGH